MTFPFVDATDTTIPQPEQRLPGLRQALATVAPARLSEFFEEMQCAFTEAGEQETGTPIRMFHRKWAVAIAIERRPRVASTLREAERSVNAPDPQVREQAIRTAGELVRAAHRKAEGV